MEPGTLLIRADANVSIGTGHVMRCLALAQARQDAGGQATFVMACSTPALSRHLRDEGVRLVLIDAAAGSEDDLGQTIALAQGEVASWVVLDGYQFGPHYQRTLIDAGLKVLALDDHGHCGAYFADFVLDQNIEAREDLYRNRSAHTKLLLGTKYALLRREYTPLRGYRREIPAVARNLLVAMGGSDPNNVTLQVLDAIDQVDVSGLSVVVVAGGSNPHTASITERITASRHDCRLLGNVTNMPELIARADLAISAAGTVCWEYCLLGLPAVLLPVAENQIPTAKALHAAGAAVLAGERTEAASGEMAQLVTRLLNSAAERQALSRKAQSVVDGHGAERVLSSLLAARVS